MYLLYNTLLVIALPFVVAYHLYRSASRGRPAALRQRFGYLLSSETESVTGSDSRPIWVHAVSVGESVACRPLLKALKIRYPARKLFVSTMTETGRTVAAGFPEVDSTLYFPFDYPCAVRRMLNAVKPAVIVVVETELWPNFLREARLSGIPVVIANGRISDRSNSGYMRAKAFFRPVLAHIARFCMQSEEDAKRIIAIGARAEHVIVARNLKFDIPAVPVSDARRHELRHTFRVPSDATIITAGSTHDGEDEPVVAAYLELLAEFPNLFLVLVPRHPERAQAVAQLVKRHGIVSRNRSQLSSDDLSQQPGELLLVDTVGELMQFYALSDMVFVGGSMVPTGGHNLLEPASQGTPVVYGPHMDNFREIASLVRSYGAGLQIESASVLSAAFRELLADPVRCRHMGEAGIRLLQENGGATERHMAVIEQLMTGET